MIDYTNPKVIEVKTSLPPSVNKAYKPVPVTRNTVYGQVTKSEKILGQEARAWKDEHLLTLRGKGWNVGQDKKTPWGYSAILHVGKGRHFIYDLSNRWKVFEDVIASLLGVDDRYMVDDRHTKFLRPERISHDFILAKIYVFLQPMKGKKS
jgi:hypothetical protein